MPSYFFVTRAEQLHLTLQGSHTTIARRSHRARAMD